MRTNSSSRISRLSTCCRGEQWAPNLPTTRMPRLKRSSPSAVNGARLGRARLSTYQKRGPLRYTLTFVVSILLVLIAAAVIKVALHTSMGFVVFGVGLLGWEILSRVRPKSTASSPDELRDQARQEGLTEVMTRAAEGNTPRIKELLTNGDDINATSPSGTTALMYAARSDRVDCVRYLLASGADPSAVQRKVSLPCR